jgi:hypothetical protein
VVGPSRFFLVRAPARLVDATIAYAPWSGSHSSRELWDSAGTWSPEAFAKAVRLPEEHSDLETACRRVAEKVAMLVRGE